MVLGFVVSNFPMVSVWVFLEFCPQEHCRKRPQESISVWVFFGLWQIDFDFYMCSGRGSCFSFSANDWDVCSFRFPALVSFHFRLFYHEILSFPSQIWSLGTSFCIFFFDIRSSRSLLSLGRERPGELPMPRIFYLARSKVSVLAPPVGISTGALLLGQLSSFFCSVCTVASNPFSREIHLRRRNSTKEKSSSTSLASQGRFQNSTGPAWYNARKLNRLQLRRSNICFWCNPGFSLLFLRGPSPGIYTNLFCSNFRQFPRFCLMRRQCNEKCCFRISCRRPQFLAAFLDRKMRLFLWWTFCLVSSGIRTLTKLTVFVIVLIS